MLNIKNYKKNRVEKLDAVTTTVSIERKHKVFIDSVGINLSALVRDAIDLLMKQEQSKRRNKQENDTKTT